MVTKPKPTVLSRATGISVPYASQILSEEADKARTPSRPLAIHIFRKTGWRHSSIAHLSDEQIALFEQEEPWVERAA